MQARAMKALAICGLGVALMTGCASRPTSTTTANAQRSVMEGKITNIETATATDQPAGTYSSGSSTNVPTATSSPPIATVQFNDGTQQRYYLTDYQAPLKVSVGDQVQLVTVGDRTVLVRP